jgi:hypothetical protein
MLLLQSDQPEGPYMPTNDVRPIGTDSDDMAGAPCADEPLAVQLPGIVLGVGLGGFWRRPLPYGDLARRPDRPGNSILQGDGSPSTGVGVEGPVGLDVSWLRAALGFAGWWLKRSGVAMIPDSRR